VPSFVLSFVCIDTHGINASLTAHVVFVSVRPNTVLRQNVMYYIKVSDYMGQPAYNGIRLHTNPFFISHRYSNLNKKTARYMSHILMFHITNQSINHALYVHVKFCFLLPYFSEPG
jgi:hypothetical protein